MRPSLKFYFKNPNSKGKQEPKLIFVDESKIFVLNYELDEITIQTDCSINPLSDIPTCFMMSSDQTVSIFCDSEDCLLFDHKNDALVDLDNLTDIQNIKELEYDPEENMFYIFGN